MAFLCLSCCARFRHPCRWLAPPCCTTHMCGRAACELSCHMQDTHETVLVMTKCCDSRGADSALLLLHAAHRVNAAAAG